MNAKIYPTMITPFNEDRSIDYNGVAEIIEWYIENGCDGLFAICQSSEMFYMSLSERLELAKFIVDKAKGRLEIVASGHISSSLDAQIEEMKAIAKTNVKAIVFVSNRFADSYENDDIWLNNMKRVIDSIESRENNGGHFVRRKIMSVLLKSLIAVAQERNLLVDITPVFPGICSQSFPVHQPRFFHKFCKPF